MSSCCIAINEAYNIPITESVITTELYDCEACGNTGSNQRITANTPILTITPLNNIVTAVGACSYVSGCHVWKGKIGILIASAIKNSQNIHCCCPAERSA